MTSDQHRPTSRSVTTEPCTCGYLQRAVDDPDTPIQFDERCGEYHFVYGDAMLVIYHCPFCGGAAPPSVRESLFFHPSEDERNRLRDLFRDCRTVDDVIEKHGPPDWVSPVTKKSDEADATPPTVSFWQTLVYQRLSDVADVHVDGCTDGPVRISLQGKPRPHRPA